MKIYFPLSNINELCTALSKIWSRKKIKIFDRFYDINGTRGAFRKKSWKNFLTSFKREKIITILRNAEDK